MAHFWSFLGLGATKLDPEDPGCTLELQLLQHVQVYLIRSRFSPSACMAVSAQLLLETFIREVSSLSWKSSCCWTSVKYVDCQPRELVVLA